MRFGPRFRAVNFQERSTDPKATGNMTDPEIQLAKQNLVGEFANPEDSTRRGPVGTSKGYIDILQSAKKAHPRFAAKQ